MVEVFVEGRPTPQGSKRLVQPKGSSRPRMIEASPKVHAWRRTIRDRVALERELPPFPGPWSVDLMFHFRRPKRLIRTGVGDQYMADLEHLARPDLDKLTRAVLDACTGILWDDDSQVCRLSLGKRYSDREGVRILAREGIHL